MFEIWYFFYYVALQHVKLSYCAFQSKRGLGFFGTQNLLLLEQNMFFLGVSEGRHFGKSPANSRQVWSACYGFFTCYIRVIAGCHRQSVDRLHSQKHLNIWEMRSEQGNHNRTAHHTYSRLCMCNFFHSPWNNETIAIAMGLYAFACSLFRGNIAVVDEPWAH